MLRHFSMSIQKVSQFPVFHYLLYAPIALHHLPLDTQKDKMIEKKGFFFFYLLELKCKQDSISEQEKTHKYTMGGCINHHSPLLPDSGGV